MTGLAFIPCNENILVKPDKARISLIVAPETSNEGATSGIVLAKGELVGDSVRVNQRVLFAEHAGTLLSIGGEEVKMIQPLDILGVIDVPE